MKLMLDAAIRPYGTEGGNRAFFYQYLVPTGQCPRAAHIIKYNGLKKWYRNDAIWK